MTFSIVQTLKERMITSAQPNLTERLFEALYDNDFTAFVRYIDEGANVNGRTPSTGPIIVHAATASVQFVRCLITRGADVKTRLSKDNASALHVACSFHGETVELLLMNDALDDPSDLNSYIVRTVVNNNLRGLKALVYFSLRYPAYKKTLEDGIFCPKDNACSDFFMDCGFRAQKYSIDTRWNEYLKKTDEERDELKRTTLDNLRKEVSESLLVHVRNSIIEICILLFSVDLPPYVVLEIIDWLPNYVMVQHRCKIDLIYKCFASLRKIKFVESER